jgi:hypothetical protein
MILLAVQKAAITAILYGAILFGLGMIPGMLATLAGGLQNFMDDLSPTRGPIDRSPTGLRLSGDIWLFVGGGAMMIVGLVALVSG